MQNSLPHPRDKHAVEKGIEVWLFRSRWLLAPFYFGLVVALGALLVAFVNEAIHEFTQLGDMKPRTPS